MYHTHPIRWLVALLVSGLIVGALGRLIVPGRNPIGFFGTLAVGLVGAFVGALIAFAIGVTYIWAFVIEVLVAALIVWLISGRPRRFSRRPYL